MSSRTAELLQVDFSTQVFHTQYSTPRHNAIAQRGLILLTEVGSTMHGVSASTTADDIDEMGICVEPPEVLCGLEPFEQYEYRTQPVNVRSGPNDIDRTVYGLRKWARLAAAGNPTVLMPLFVSAPEHLRYNNSFGFALRRNKALFLSQQAGHKFLGYLDGQRQRYLDPDRSDSKHASRPELVEQYGWDTKTGYHALRLAIQGMQLMKHGTIELPMAGGHREFLLDVRAGVYPKDQVTALLDTHYIPALKENIEASTLPEKPNYEKLNAWLARTTLDFWEDENVRAESCSA